MLRVGLRTSVASPLWLRLLHRSAPRHLFKGDLASASPNHPPPSSPVTHPILKRIPRFLRPYTSNFINAPLSHVTAFLILHELTAIVPLVGFWYLFHKYHWMIPMDLPTWAIERGSKIIDSSLERFDFSTYSVGDKFAIVTEGAYAFVVVKFLLPLRILLSVTLMPSFARWFIIPFTKMWRRNKTPPPPAVSLSPKAHGDHVDTAVKTKKIDKPRL